MYTMGHPSKNIGDLNNKPWAFQESQGYDGIQPGFTLN
jgi:hypothetical protein